MFFFIFPPIQSVSLLDILRLKVLDYLWMKRMNERLTPIGISPSQLLRRRRSGNNETSNRRTPSNFRLIHLEMSSFQARRKLKLSLLDMPFSACRHKDKHFYWKSLLCEPFFCSAHTNLQNNRRLNRKNIGSFLVLFHQGAKNADEMGDFWKRHKSGKSGKTASSVFKIQKLWKELIMKCIGNEWGLFMFVGYIILIILIRFPKAVTLKRTRIVRMKRIMKTTTDCTDETDFLWNEHGWNG